jgi:predicted LPLAT superfamily acyltransferase
LVLYFVVFYYVFLRPSIRRKTEYYLSRRFPGRKTLGRLLDSYRLSLQLGKTLVDRAIVGILGPGQMDVELTGQERLFDLLDKGTGLVLLTAHVGCWQVALSALHFLKVPVTMVLQQEEGNVDRHYFEHAGLPCPYQTIDPGGYLGGSLEMMRVLKEGSILCMMGDRVFGSRRNTLCCDFLGEPALFPYSAFKLASATGVPLVVLLSNKTGPKTYALNVAKVIEVPQREGRSGEAFRPYLTQFVGALESFSMEYPYQFFNFHDMWDGCS